MLRAAVANGADAVYFGLEDFNARMRAANFSIAELQRVIDYLHARNVRGYVAFNTLVFPQELARARQLLLAIAKAGADAIIVQDTGIALLARRLAPTLAVHASTQMTQTHAEGLAGLAELGITRAILARELSMEQIRQIAAASCMELEVFVHGALCMSYSGQCLASHCLLGRSANRGRCAQFCRLPCGLAVNGKLLDLRDKKYLLSPRDLAAWSLVRRLAHAGIAGLKIEGRLKSPQYVAATVQVYRAALDAAAHGQAFQPFDQQRRQLDTTFSRGFTDGYLAGRRGGEVVDGEHPASRGRLVGKLLEVQGRRLLARLSEPLKPGDGLAIEDAQGCVQGGRLYAIQPATSRARDCWLLSFGPDVDLSQARSGSPIRRTNDPQIQKQLELTYSKDVVPRRMPLTFRVEANVGQPLHLAASDEQARRATAAGETPLQQAIQRPLTLRMLAEQLDRLGDTPFSLGGVELLSNGQAVEQAPVLAPKSLLNELRRRVVDELMTARVQASRHHIQAEDALETLRAAAHRPPQETQSQAVLHVLVRRGEQVEAVLGRRDLGVETVFLELHDLEALGAAAQVIRQSGVKLGLVTARVLAPGQERSLEAILGHRPDVVLVRNLAAMRWLRRSAPHLALVADASLNGANDLSLAWLLAAGAHRVNPAADLDFKQLGDLLEHGDTARVEIVLHQHVPLMYAQHCLFAAAREALSHAQDAPGEQPRPRARAAGAERLPNAGGRACSDASCRKHCIDLVDRLGQPHPVEMDAFCRNTIFNSHAQSAMQAASQMLSLGIRHFRLELLRDSAAQTAGILALYAGVLSGRQSGNDAWRQLQQMLNGAVTRGAQQARDVRLRV